MRITINLGFVTIAAMFLLAYFCCQKIKPMIAPPNSPELRAQTAPPDYGSDEELQAINKCTACVDKDKVIRFLKEHIENLQQQIDEDTEAIAGMVEVAKGWVK